MTDKITAYSLALIAIYYLGRAALWILSSRPIANDPYDQPHGWEPAVEVDLFENVDGEGR